jgi:hypothetical protein
MKGNSMTFFSHYFLCALDRMFSLYTESLKLVPVPGIKTPDIINICIRLWVHLKTVMITG